MSRRILRVAGLRFPVLRGRFLGLGLGSLGFCRRQVSTKICQPEQRISHPYPLPSQTSCLLQPHLKIA